MDEKARYSVCPARQILPPSHRQSGHRNRLSGVQPSPLPPPQQTQPLIPKSLDWGSQPSYPPQEVPLPTPSLLEASEQHPSSPPPLPPLPPLPPPLPREAMHSTCGSTASSMSLTKSPMLPITAPPQPQRQHPKTAYFHGGIGGRGNYRKVIRENDKAPLAHAANAQPQRRRSSPPRFLFSLFGSKRSRRGDHANVGGEDGGDVRASESLDSVREEVSASLGAAEIMRRKILGQYGGKGRGRS